MSKPHLLKGFIPKQATYTLRAAMAYLSLGQTTVRDLIRRGELRRSMSVRKVILKGEDVETFMDRTT